LSALDPIDREHETLPPRAPLTSMPVDPLASHITAMIRNLDEEVTRLREEAATEANRVIDAARAEAERIVEDATRQVADAEARRDAVLAHRAAVISELRTIRDTIVSLASRVETDDSSPSAPRNAGTLPPPPRRRLDENQEPLWSEADADGEASSD
jgi:cell division septum initiation protein DivIVA